jgi:hypothetical protein
MSRRASQSFGNAEVELLDALLRNVKRGRIADVIGLAKRHEQAFEALCVKVAAMKRTSAGPSDAVNAQHEQEAKAS